MGHSDINFVIDKTGMPDDTHDNCAREWSAMISFPGLPAVAIRVRMSSSHTYTPSESVPVA